MNMRELILHLQFPDDPSTRPEIAQQVAVKAQTTQENSSITTYAMFII